MGYKIIKIKEDNPAINDFVLGNVYSDMGSLLVEKKNPVKARVFFEKALAFGVERNQSFLVNNSFRDLSKYQNLSNETKKNIQDYLTKFNEKKNSEILNKINAVKNYNNLLAHEKKYVKQNEYIVYFIVALFLALIVLKFLIYAFIKQKRYLATINSQKLELSKQNKDLTKLNAKINFEYGKIEKLNSTLSHDIKSGIVSIKEIASRINLGNEVLDINSISQKIIDETDCLTETINFLLDEASSKKSSSVASENIEWRKILKQVENSLEHLILLTHPTISLNSNLPLFLGYKTHFYQLFKNLIENSLKYSDPSKKCIISINIKKTDENKLIIEYEDNGIGMNDKNIKQVFEYFNQLEFEHISKGYGLGLGICKKIVDSYNGKISVTSIPGQKTNFSIMMNELTH